MDKSYIINPLTEKDKPWAAQILTKRWGSPTIVSRGKLHRLEDLNGFISKKGQAPVGLVTYVINGNTCEIVSLDSLVKKQGIGIALVEEVKRAAKSQGCSRVWVITINDNLDALRFYQKRGFSLVAVYRNALDLSRKLKPEIPFVGNHDIPLRDEIELEILL